MKTFVLKSFQGALSDKIQAVQILVKYDQETGLRVAKEKVDQLTAGTSVQCTVEEESVSGFKKALSALQITYETA
ncbi:MAG: hypothetical protein WA958_18365 [Tunicatimonas sp.]